MYGHYRTHGPGSAWNLPKRWRTPPDGFDRSTPVNMVATNDITGGNSGSPVVNRDLELVGLAFDGNIESLAGDYIYLPGRMRTVAVDVRGMLEALGEIYDADRLVQEVLGGAFVETEADASDASPR
jgi:S1-C subfamily serine protease